VLERSVAAGPSLVEVRFMEAHDSSLRIVPNALDGGNRHICAFFNGMDEHYRVLRSFIKDGFDSGDKAFHLIDPKRREDHLRRLADAGIDVEEATASGQLEVHPWEDGPLHGERFDQDTWLAGFEEVLQSGAGSGYAKTRSWRRWNGHSSTCRGSTTWGTT
jgi:MEDS: MEthanogen/methylotroph, DcmR Sensory domain